MAVPVIVMALGLLIVLRASVILKRIINEMNKQSLKCEAKVTEVSIVDLTNEHGYRMKYEADTAEGKVVFRDVLARSNRIREGRTVTIHFEPRNHKNFRVGFFDSRLVFPLAFLFIGCIITAIGVIFMIQVL